MICRRCGAVLVEAEGPGAFWDCASCDGRFRLTGDGELVERWLGALSLVLYRVQFSPDPRPRATSDAAQVVAELSRPELEAQLTQLVDEIQSELDQPTQRVGDILDLQADEDVLREYLALVADEIRGILDRSRP